MLVLNCNSLQFALLGRSLPTVKKILKDRPSSVTHRNSLGQNSLHLASDWPEATQLLLSTGAELHQSDSNGNLPISYACVLRSFDTTELLFAHGGPLSSGGGFPLLDVCAQHSTLRIFSIVATALAQRRLELLQTARSFLLEATLRKLLPPDEELPDASSSKLINAVKDAGCPTDPNYWYLTTKSVYDTPYLSAEGADILFEAGFTHVDGQDERGRTPLMCLSQYAQPELIEWFSRKRVSFTKVEKFFTIDGIVNATPTIHWPALGIARSVVHDILSTYHGKTSILLSGDLYKALMIILSSEFAFCVDQCNCHCSQGGCNPIVIMLRKREEIGSNKITMKQRSFIEYHNPLLPVSSPI